MQSVDQYHKRLINVFCDLLLLIAIFYGCYYSYKMSSITRQNYSTFQQSCNFLWMRLEQQFDACRQKSQVGALIDQTLWQQFEEDLKQVFRALGDLSEIVEEEWSTIDKLEGFIKNLEMDNTELFEQNQQNSLKYEQNEQQKLQQSQIIQELKQMLYLQHRKKQVEVNQQQQNLIKQYKMSQIQLELQLAKLRKDIQSISLEKDQILEELQLKNTEIELAQLVIQDLRKNNSKMQHIYSTVCQQRQDTKSFSSSDSRSNSNEKAYKRHNSLLQDLVQSEILNQHRINQQMFQSTQTIEQAIQDKNQQVSNIEIKSCIKLNCKKSKAVSVHFIPQFKDSCTQTENSQPFYQKCFGLMRDKIISQRIKK